LSKLGQRYKKDLRMAVRKWESFQQVFCFIVPPHKWGGGWAEPKNGEAYFWAWVGGAV